jgi:hypothetical protein
MPLPAWLMESARGPPAPVGDGSEARLQMADNMLDYEDNVDILGHDITDEEEGK